MKPTSTSGAAGFTFLELIVVILIIMILAALLIPIIGSVWDKGRSAKCFSNLKQLHTAAMTFAADNEGHLPHSASFEHLVTVDAPTGGRRAEWRKHHTGWVDWYRHENRIHTSAPNPPWPPTRTSDVCTYWWGGKGKACIEQGTLYSYAGGRGVYLCPKFAMKAVCGLSGTNGAVRSYVMNGQLSDAHIHSAGASRTLLFTDGPSTRKCNCGRCSGDASYCLKDDGPDDPSSVTDGRKFKRGRDGELTYKYGSDVRFERIGTYHGQFSRVAGRIVSSGLGNAVFADGHTEKLRCIDTTNVCTGVWGAY